MLDRIGLSAYKAMAVAYENTISLLPANRLLEHNIIVAWRTAEKGLRFRI